MITCAARLYRSGWLETVNFQVLQFFSFAFAQFSNEKSIFQNIKLKPLNNELVHNRLEFLIHSSKLRCFGTYVQRVGLSTILYKLQKNHFYMGR